MVEFSFWWNFNFVRDRNDWKFIIWELGGFGEQKRNKLLAFSHHENEMPDAKILHDRFQVFTGV